MKEYLREDFPAEAIKDCSAGGRVDEAVNYWCVKLNFTVPREPATEYLLSTGAWEKEDLEELDDDELSEKILWLMCCDFNEGSDTFYLTA